MPSRWRRAVFDRDGHRCLNCSSREDLTLDHIDPQGRGLANLQTLCWDCNVAKGSRKISYIYRRPQFPYAHRV